MKLALCNEVLRHLSWDAQCQYVAALTEADPPHAVLACHLPLGHIAHVQLNDANRRGILETLQ